jgi:hypothetical protein
LAPTAWVVDQDASDASTATAGGASPCDGSLLGCIHILFAARFEEEGFHVLREEAARLGVHQVQTIVVDKHHLLAGPLTPAILTDLTDNADSDRTWEWWALEPRLCLTAPTAFYVCHLFTFLDLPQN